MAENKAAAVCINSVLPDEILEEILSKLPLPCIVGARRICTKWKQIIHSTAFQNRLSSHKPWYLCLERSHASPYEYKLLVYDQVIEQWDTLKFPFGKLTHPVLIAFSSGLVCFELRGSIEKELYVFNLVTQQLRAIPGYPARTHDADSYALTMSGGRTPGSYSLVVILEKVISTETSEYRREIHVYSSERAAWETPEASFFRSGYFNQPIPSVICDEVALIWHVYNRDGAQYLCSYDLFSGSAFKKDLIPMPSLDLYPRINLMNMKGKVVMVGRGYSSDGVRIWLLEDKEWIEVAKMPYQYYKEFCFGVRSCSGLNETIYIQHGSSGKLVIFDMETGQWRWAKACPTTKGRRVMSGICFEPRFNAIA